MDQAIVQAIATLLAVVSGRFDFRVNHRLFGESKAPPKVCTMMSKRPYSCFTNRN